MKIKDLNIGNWVVINGEPARALRLTQVGHSIFKGLSGQLYRVIGYSISPLPITSEILEKNGFEKVLSIAYEEFKWSESEKKITLSTPIFVESDDFTLFVTSDMGLGSCFLRIKYVHELQHAMRLVGIEKEIEA